MTFDAWRTHPLPLATHSVYIRLLVITHHIRLDANNSPESVACPAEYSTNSVHTRLSAGDKGGAIHYHADGAALSISCLND